MSTPFYRDDIENIEPGEQETHDKIIELMTEGMHLVREESGENIRISHATAGIYRYGSTKY